MEFPNEIKEYILSYLPHPYKRPTHLEAINRDPLFADMSIDRLLILELKNLVDGGYECLWMNSYVEYRKWRCMINFTLQNR